MAATAKKKVKRKPGRPPKYSNAIGRQIVDAVTEHGSVSKAARDLGLQRGWKIVWDWQRAGHMVDGEPLQEAIDTARRQHAMVLQDSLTEVMEELEWAGKAEQPNPAAVSAMGRRMQGIQWQLSKLLPRLYGDKVEHTGNVEHGITVQMVTYGATPSIADESRARSDAPLVIDSTHEESTT